jgi:hypothetical protein
MTTQSSFAIALVLAVFVSACGDDSDTDGTSTGGTGGGKAGSGGSSTGGSGGSSTGGSGGSAGSAGSGATGGTTATGGSGGLAGAGGSGGSAGGTSDAQCHAMTAPKCRQCCGDGHSEGHQAYDTAYTACVCQAANCGSQCQQSVCATPANPGPTPSCNSCLGDVTGATGACAPATVQAACTDPSCAAYITCVAGCPQ